ncbi:YkgJ family cysteine cluster protein [uncultured Desulfuromusa sp.]|uniref:YkgJ family cysteine cluster protein n=1 Tax=uncultured Desulfuromusa sp. TaxID=219183 RepID=UPI002AA76A8B|nr:YkgJ family cysteine cluster protein [uncultured Desulfuromusa sp.]
MKKEKDTALVNSKEWEDICERCGRCCYEKYEYRGKIFYSDTPCKYLDTKTHLCRIYHQRFKLNPECVCLSPELVKTGILPEDCPYVKNSE